MSVINKSDLVYSISDTASFFQANDTTLFPYGIDNSIPMIVVEKIESDYTDTIFYFCLYTNYVLLIRDKFLVHVK